jgi:carboxylate-amine ligase
VTIEARFGESRPFSIGVEEEIMILDAESLEQRPAVEELLRVAAEIEHPGVLKTELHASVVELNTGVCESAPEALERLVRLRTVAAEAAERIGLRIAAAGTHPLTRAEELVIVDKPRYRGFVEYAGVSARRQGVNGLHVHVGVADSDACFRALDGILPWLPVVLAISANSPYFGGEETGLMSNRAEILAQLPRSGAPPAFGSYGEWEDFVERFRASGVPLGKDYTSFWWDVRPHPRFGTLEIRMPDQPTRVELAGAFAALLQALCRTVLEADPRADPPWARGVHQQNRWAAARFGARAELIHPDEPRIGTAAELMRELLEQAAPAAVELGGDELLSTLDGAACEAERQLEVGGQDGLQALCRELADRTLDSP